MLIVVVVGSFPAPSGHAATIIRVSDNRTPVAGVPNDRGRATLPGAREYTFDLNFRSQQGRTLDVAKIAALNAADLIIMSRVVISRDTNGGDDAHDQEPTPWNEIPKPILLLNSYMARNNCSRGIDAASIDMAQPTPQAVAAGHAPPARLIIGVHKHDSLSRFLPGAIDEVGLHNCVLPQTEIGGRTGLTLPFDNSF